MKTHTKRVLLISLVCCLLTACLGLSALATGGTADATLSSLEVSPGTLTPTFSSNVYEYQVEVGADCDKLLVSGKTTDSGAKMVIAGNDGLKAGSNTVIVSVTAADGVTKAKYTITVIRGSEQGESGSLPAQADSTQPAQNASGESIGNSPLSGPNLSGSQASGSTEGQQTDQATTASSGTVTSAGKTYTLSEPAEGLVPSGFIAVDVTIGDQTVKGWRFSDSEAEGFYLLYGTDEAGKTTFYIYDATEGTVITAPEGILTMNQESQISQNQLKTAQTSYQKRLQFRLYIIIALAVLCFILLIALTASVTGHKHGKETAEVFDEPEEEVSHPVAARERARRAYELDEEYEEEEEDFYADGDEDERNYHVSIDEPEHEDVQDDFAGEAEYEDEADEFAGEPEYEDEADGFAGEPEYEHEADEFAGELEDVENLELFDEEPGYEEEPKDIEISQKPTAPVQAEKTIRKQEVSMAAPKQEKLSESAQDDDLELIDLDLDLDDNLDEAEAEPEFEDIPALEEDDLEEDDPEEDDPEEDDPEEDDRKEDLSEDDFDVDLEDLVLENLDLGDDVPAEANAEPAAAEPAAAEPEYEEESEEPAEASKAEDDLDADFDLLEALLSDSVRSGKPEGKDSIVNRAARQAGRKEQHSEEEAPVNPVRELKRKK